MDKIKKSVLKGFTLVELMVVMAIFSVLMAAALALTTPVSRMYKNTALAEKTYSFSHNIQEYLQGTLEYADSLYVLTGDNLGDYDTMLDLAEDFRKTHYGNVVVSDDGTSTRGLRGKIYILRLMNNEDTVNGETVPAGQITLTEYWFDNHDKEENAEITLGVAERPVLNPAYFEASDSNYSFSYALTNGADSHLVTLSGTQRPSGEGIDSSDTYKAIKRDLEDDPIAISQDRLSVAIVLDKDQSSNGYVDVEGYRAFKAPVAVQVANLPLTNINTTSAQRPNKEAGFPRVVKETDGSIRLQKYVGIGTNPPECGWSFWTEKANPKIDFSNDIYFVYAYGDELR